MSTTAATTGSSVARSRRGRKRNEFRFQLIRCSDPNRSVARILELKTHQRNGNKTLYTLFQLKDVLDDAVLTALLDTFRHFVAAGIKWRTLDIQDDMRNHMNRGIATRGGSPYNASLLHELLQVVNESSLFQNIQLTILGTRDNHHFAMLPPAEPNANPDNNSNNSNVPSSFFQSIERNTRLLKLCIDFDGNQLSNEDIQSLVTLLKNSKKLKRLEINCRGFKIEDLSEGFAHNSTLISLSLKTTPTSNISMLSENSSSSMRAMMEELSQHQGLMKLQKLTLSSTCDGEISSPLESLLFSQQGLKMVNLHCQPSNNAFSFQNASPSPRNSAFDSFFRRLSSISPPNSSGSARSTRNNNNQMQTDGSNKSEEQTTSTLDQYLIEQGPLITIGTELYSTTTEQIATAKRALQNYPRLRLNTNVHRSPAEIGYKNLLNHCGRYLMYRSDVPLGLWPVALERAACLESHKRQRSSIIYELLHGGVFAAREAYASI